MIENGHFLLANLWFFNYKKINLDAAFFTYKTAGSFIIVQKKRHRFPIDVGLYQVNWQISLPRSESNQCNAHPENRRKKISPNSPAGIPIPSISRSGRCSLLEMSEMGIGSWMTCFPVKLVCEFKILLIAEVLEPERGKAAPAATIGDLEVAGLSDRSGSAVSLGVDMKCQTNPTKTRRHKN